MKSVLSAILLLSVSSYAFAGSCPVKLRIIDRALSSGNVENADQVKALRDEGEALHNTGDHSASVAVLKRAMQLGGIKN